MVKTTQPHCRPRQLRWCGPVKVPIISCSCFCGNNKYSSQARISQRRGSWFILIFLAEVRVALRLCCHLDLYDGMLCIMYGDLSKQEDQKKKNVACSNVGLNFTHVGSVQMRGFNIENSQVQNGRNNNQTSDSRRNARWTFHLKLSWACDGTLWCDAEKYFPHHF